MLLLDGHLTHNFVLLSCLYNVILGESKVLVLIKVVIIFSTKTKYRQLYHVVIVLILACTSLYFQTLANKWGDIKNIDSIQRQLTAKLTDFADEQKNFFFFFYILTFHCSLQLAALKHCKTTAIL